MPQKKNSKPSKNAKADKAKKPAKSAKPGLGAALKRAAKDLGKKIGGGLNAKKAAPAVSPKKAAVAKVAKKAPVPSVASAKGKKPVSAPLKAKKEVAPPPVPAKVAKVVPTAKGKKAEVVLEVPAPKGVAVIAKDGKKKGKASAEAAASKKNRCREPGCDHDFVLTGYCRLHYIKNWRRIKRKEGIIASGQLNNYVEELVNKYPDKYLDVIRQDLSSEKEWGKVVVDLELEASEDDAAGDDEADTAAEGVRPSSSSSSSRGGEFDDDGDAF